MEVVLNNEGRQIWGDIFPKGRVPVLSFTFSNTNLGKVIFVNWRLLSAGQRDAVVEKIAKLSNQPAKVVLEDIELKGLPLRESVTTGAVVAETRFFI